MKTVGIAWIVCRQFQDGGKRFAFEGEARQYAEALARKLNGEIVEVFACTNNLHADIPVVELAPELPAAAAPETQP